LINHVIAAQLPQGGPVAALAIRVEAGNRFTAHVRLRRLAFLPPIRVPFAIARQPDLPSSPEIVLNVEGLAALASPALRLLNVLPPWVRADGSHIFIDLAALAASHGAPDALGYVQALSVTTERGRLIVSVRAGVRH
jgi:hypothetical protein